jgi:adenylosuccinate synthase
MADVVIGAAYGDEGKGNAVNLLATPDSIVVRFNGTANAGHTAIHNGHRHVFGHFGAGTLKGAATYLSRFFLCNPPLFLDEYKTLAKFKPTVFISALAPVTTPYDVAINIMAERTRGSGRHGSVGVGLGETVERTENGYGLLVGMLADPDATCDLMRRIAAVWVPRRCEALGIDLDAHPDFKAMIEDPDVPEVFWGDCDSMLDKSNVLYAEKPMSDWGKHVIFEGAQGLLLDQHWRDFPHVTRSSTGLTNVLALTNEPLNVYYMSRAYTTRHGAGPLPFELHAPPYPGVADNTNVTNEHQGSLRYSYLDLDRIGEAIQLDRQRFGQWLRDPANQSAKTTLATFAVTTCMDQLPDDAHFIQVGRIRCEPRMELAKAFGQVVGGPAYFLDRPDAEAFGEVLAG